MSQIEQLVMGFFSKNPDIRIAGEKGLVNRRALARYIIKESNLKMNQLDAVIAVLRRNEEVKKHKGVGGIELGKIIKEMKISSKEDIIIMTLEKNHGVFEKIRLVSDVVQFNKNQTFKLIEGSLSVKLVFDEVNLVKVKEIFNKKDIIGIEKDIAELSIIFPDEAILTRGIVSTITSYLFVSGVNIIELLTCTPELLFYIKEDDLIDSYSVIKQLKNS